MSLIQIGGRRCGKTDGILRQIEAGEGMWGDSLMFWFLDGVGMVTVRPENRSEIVKAARRFLAGSWRQRKRGKRMLARYATKTSALKSKPAPLNSFMTDPPWHFGRDLGEPYIAELKAERLVADRWEKAKALDWYFPRPNAQEES